MPVHILIQSVHCVGSVILNSKEKSHAIWDGKEVRKCLKVIYFEKQFISLSIFFK